tara:strand:- start:1946 stop:2269 length:324 start_codon:yes stop_codon:yes gene_type:complete
MAYFLNKVKNVSGPSQPKVEDEQWSDDRIKGFLLLKPQDEANPDYHILRQAYQHMTAAFFARFIVMFVEAGHDINAQSLEGETLLSRISSHMSSTDYAQVLKDHGAI